MTNLTPEQMMADVKLLRAATLGFAPHKQTLEEKLSFIEYMSREGAGDPATKALLVRLHQALTATNRPEYREEK